MVAIARQSLLRATGLASCARANASAISPAKRIMAVQQFRLASSATTAPIPGTASMSPAENIALLNEQRLKRPNSPHLSIYQPQLTWYLSSLTRVTGVALSGSLYLFSLAYLLHPSILTSFDSAHIIQFAQDLPGWVKGSIKLPLAGMFWFHSFNGVRHLAWDIGYGLTLKGVYAGGYAVLAATAVASVYCSFFL